jgi:DNA polymerase III subunit delta'
VQAARAEDATGDLWAIPAPGRVTGVLADAVARGDVGHAWAFLGPPDVGQQQAARAFACAANGVAGDPVQVERFRRGAHPAYTEFVPVGAVHRKEEVHGRWLAAANATIREGRVKVLRVVAADRMNDNAANAFLKALEEPPPGTVWILDIGDPDELPDTILSRCRAVTFAPWTRAQLADLAASLGLAGPDAELAVRLAMGSPTALRRLADPQALADHRAHRGWLAGVRAHGPGFALQASRALKDEIARRTKAVEAEGAAELSRLGELYGDEPPRSVVKELDERYTHLARAQQTTAVQQALDDLVGWCRDALVVAGGGGPDAVRNVDDLAALREHAGTLSAAALLGICDSAQAVREAVEVNARWDLAVEAFILGAHARVLAG